MIRSDHRRLRAAPMSMTSGIDRPQYPAPAPMSMPVTQYGAAIALANQAGGAGVSNAAGVQQQNPPGYGYNQSLGIWTPTSGNGPNLVWNGSAFVPATAANTPNPATMAQLNQLAMPTTPFTEVAGGVTTHYGGSTPATASIQTAPVVANQKATQPIAPAIPFTVAPAPIVPAEMPDGDFPYYTADIETVQQEMYQYGDTWDNAQSIVNALYASGVVPGTVTPAMAFNSLTGITAEATTTTAPASILTSPSTWPWYAWAGLAALGFFAFSGGSAKK
jgi:hypothetical protein